HETSTKGTLVPRLRAPSPGLGDRAFDRSGGGRGDRPGLARVVAFRSLQPRRKARVPKVGRVLSGPHVARALPSRRSLDAHRERELGAPCSAFAASAGRRGSRTPAYTRCVRGGDWHVDGGSETGARALGDQRRARPGLV